MPKIKKLEKVKYNLPPSVSTYQPLELSDAIPTTPTIFQQSWINYQKLLIISLKLFKKFDHLLDKYVYLVWRIINASANRNNYSISATPYRINEGKHLDPQDRKNKYTSLMILHDQNLDRLDQD